MKTYLGFSHQAKEKQSAKKAQEAKWTTATDTSAEKPLITHTRIQNPTVTLSSLSHIRTLYIIRHIHVNDHGWSAALLQCGIMWNHSEIKNCTAGVAERLSGKILSPCVSISCNAWYKERCAQIVLSYFHNKMSSCLWIGLFMDRFPKPFFIIDFVFSLTYWSIIDFRVCTYFYLNGPDRDKFTQT